MPMSCCSYHATRANGLCFRNDNGTFKNTKMEYKRGLCAIPSPCLLLLMQHLAGAAADLNVLFIGNSYTYYNFMPK